MSIDAATLAKLRTKHDDNIWSLRKMLKKALPVKNSIPLSSLLLGHNNLLFNTQVPASDNLVSNSKNTSATDLMFKTS